MRTSTTAAAALAALALLSSCRSGSQRSEEPPRAPVRESVAPHEIELAAWQAGDRVLVLAEGSNRKGGYQTHLLRSPEDVFPPRLVLQNVPPDGPATQAITPFTTAAWFAAGQRIDAVRVRVAGDMRTVEVRPADRLP